MLYSTLVTIVAALASVEAAPISPLSPFAPLVRAVKDTVGKSSSSSSSSKSSSSSSSSSATSSASSSSSYNSTSHRNTTASNSSSTSSYYLSYPFPTIGTPLDEYGAALQKFFYQGLYEDGVDVSFYSETLPQLSNDVSLRILEGDSDVSDLNNYNTKFEVTDLEDGKATWFVEAEDRDEEDPVILHLHGGGFAFGQFPTYFELLRQIYNNASNDRLSILTLDYDVSTVAKFPSQLRQAALTYNALANTTSNIILLGDSAGAHLALSVLRQIDLPYDGVPAIESSDKPEGVVLLSPWTNLNPDNKTGYHLSNKGKDVLTATTLDQFGRLYVDNNLDELKNASLNFYTDSKAGWSSLLPNSSNVFVTYGSNEVLRGDTESWIKLAKLPESSIHLIEGGVHDEAAFFPSNSTIPELVGSFLSDQFSDSD